jgi:steroid delta-isomerase-like uncharacterized protein
MNSLDPAKLIELFIEEVWNRGDFSNLEALVVDPYTIHSDPGDPWNGKSIDYETFRTRVGYTRRAFPDVRFNIDETISGNDKVAIRWTMAGTHLGDLPMLPSSGMPFAITGMTFYYFDHGKICGHRQVFDQLGFLAQIKMLKVGGKES